MYWLISSSVGCCPATGLETSNTHATTKGIDFLIVVLLIILLANDPGPWAMLHRCRAILTGMFLAPWVSWKPPSRSLHLG